jgi:hypothetical protein
VHLVDERSGQLLCRLYPQDKTRNASGLRASLEPLAGSVPQTTTSTPAPPPPSGRMAPLLEKLMTQRTSTGLPPAYLPMDERPPSNPSDEGCDP